MPPAILTIPLEFYHGLGANLPSGFHRRATSCSYHDLFWFLCKGKYHMIMCLLGLKYIQKGNRNTKKGGISSEENNSFKEYVAKPRVDIFVGGS